MLAIRSGDPHRSGVTPGQAIRPGYGPNPEIYADFQVLAEDFGEAFDIQSGLFDRGNPRFREAIDSTSDFNYGPPDKLRGRWESLSYDDRADRVCRVAGYLRMTQAGVTDHLPVESGLD